jgi:hypothetical protein
MYVNVPSAIIDDLQLSSGSGLVMQISRHTTPSPSSTFPSRHVLFI